MDLPDYIIGVDVSKQSLDLHSLPQGKNQQVLNAPAAIKQFISELPPAGQVLIVFEATGGYEDELVHQLLDAGHLAARVNPRLIRSSARADGKLAKTDTIDAKVIAQFVTKFKFRILLPVTTEERELQELVTRRKQLVELRTAERNRLEKIRSKLAEKSIRKIIKALDEQVDSITEQINSRTKNNELWKDKAALLSSTPGVGNITVATLIAELPELGQLNREQIASLAGLAPFNNDSGTAKGTRSIFGGRKSVRAVLYMAAVAAVRCNPVIRDFAKRLEAKGKPFKVRITACMRKLLGILNTMVKNNTHWNPSVTTP